MNYRAVEDSRVVAVVLIGSDDLGRRRYSYIVVRDGVAPVRSAAIHDPILKEATYRGQVTDWGHSQVCRSANSVYRSCDCCCSSCYATGQPRCVYCENSRVTRTPDRGTAQVLRAAVRVSAGRCELLGGSQRDRGVQW